MKLMTKEIEEKLLKADYDSTEIIVKYFYPMGRYTFYAVKGEKQGDDIIMYGYCLSPITSDFDEFGYVSLNELKSINLMERDLYFKENQTLDDLGLLS